MTDTAIAILTVSNNQGYAADQATNGMTLGDLLEMVEAAIDDLGADALVVTKDRGNRYGANWGSISMFDEIAADEDDDEDDE